MQEWENGDISGDQTGNAWKMAEYIPTDICICRHPNVVELQSAKMAIVREKRTDFLPHLVGEGITAYPTS